MYFQLLEYHRNGKRLNLTFADFLRFLLNEARIFGVENLHHHWRPIHLTCFPCQIEYFFHGDTANLSIELPYIFSQITQNQFTLNIVRNQQFADDKKLKHLFKGIDTELLQNVARLYKIDYEMFGFQYPDPLTL